MRVIFMNRSDKLQLKIMQDFLSRLESLRPYFGKFMLVGLSGIFVNQGLLTLFVSVYDIDVSIAGILAIEISILSNFFLNNFWTWKDQKEESLFKRFIKYHAVTLISGIINYLILISLTALGIHYFISNLIGIGIGSLVNFLFNHYWTFQKSQGV